MQLPEGFQSSFVDCGAVRLHFVHNAVAVSQDGRLADDRPVLVFLHGFPEYWAAWAPVFPHLAADHLLIAPDQRGFNLSDAPQEVSAYATGKLAGDIIAMTRKLLGDRRFLLCGHDWGASVAYALAIRNPERLTGLAIVNGVHPVLFQRALLLDPEQRAASQYFHILTAEGAAERMSANGFARTFSMFEKFSSSPWLGESERAGYLEAWSREGRMNAMLNWYRASPVIVPEPDEQGTNAPLRSGTPENFSVHVPHLLVWGIRDQALRPVCHAGLEEFVPDLERHEIATGDHWVIHTHGGSVAKLLRDFAARTGQ